MAEIFGLRKLYIKDDTIHPTYSFKDRTATIAVSKALEFGAKAVGCASTGDLAAAMVEHASELDYLVTCSSQQIPNLIKSYR